MDEISLTSAVRSDLLYLQENDKKMRRVGERLATGNKVNSPLDNPTSYFIAKSLKASASDIDQLQHAIGEAVNVIQAAERGLEAVTTLLRSMQSLVDAASQTSDPQQKKALARSFDETFAQINQVVRDSGYSGGNLISNQSGDPMAVVSQDLTVPLNPSATASYRVSGEFMGSGYVLHEAPGAQPAWVPDDHGAFLTGYGTTSGGSVGNLSDVALVIRLAPQVNTFGDLDHDGLLEAGEGAEIDFRLTNSGGSTATGIAFSNATISTGWGFAYNTGALLGDVAPNSTVITDTGTDLDLNLPAATNGTQFTISLNVTSDGVTKSFTFGPLTVGAIANQQAVSPINLPVPAKPTVSTQALVLDQADYDSGVFGVIFPGPPPEHKTLYAERQGLAIYHSWVYDNFESSAGINAARTDIANAMKLVRSYGAMIGSSSDVVVLREDFNNALSDTFVTGAENLTAADMNEASVNMLMLETRRKLGTTALGMAGEALQAVIKMLE